MPRLQRIASLGIAALTLITCHTVSALTLADIGQPARPPREVVYRTVAGRGLRLFVSLPDSARPAGGWPVLLCIHGGGWGSGTPEYMAHIATYFASRGMLAVNVEYRISDPKQTPRMPIQECLADCRAALRYVREHAADLEADPARIAVTGDSAGGHLAAALGTLPAEGETRPAAMILFNPVLDLVTLPWRDGIPGVATPMPGESGDGLTPEERGRLISPLHFAGEKGTPPTLLVHGTEDTCVPVEQADRFAAALKAAGNGCDYVRKGGWKHAFVIRPPYGTEATIVESLAAADGFLSSLGWIEGTPTITLADAAAAQPFPLVTDLPGNPPAGGLRHWKPPLRPLGATGAYVSVVVRPEAGRAKYELWCNAWGEDGAASRGIVVRRGESLDRLGEATTVCDGTLISDVMAPGQAAALAPGRGYTRTAMLTDPEYGYVQFCCVCPDYLPGSVPLLPAVLVSRTGEAGSFRYLGKLKGDFAAEAAKRTVWSDGGSLIRLADGRWRAYVNGFGTVLAAAESDRLDVEWRFLCAADGSIRELFAEFPKGPHGGGCFPTVLRVAEGNWHAWITDTWPPQSIWHFHSEDGLSWKRFGRQPEITRLAVDGQGIKCLRAYVAPDTQEIVGLLSVWQTGPDAEAAWMLHELRMPSDLRP